MTGFRLRSFVLAGAVTLATVAALFGASGSPASANTRPVSTARPAGLHPAMAGYSLMRLVSDKAGVAAHQDTDLVNAWGLAAGPETPWWVGDNGTSLSTI